MIIIQIDAMMKIKELRKICQYSKGQSLAKMQKKLNLGCGKDIKEGYINLDVTPNKGVDTVHNLEKTPLPFKDNEFDYILASHILEHIKNYRELLKEIYRISKPNTIIKVKAPHFTGVGAFCDDHVRFFKYGSFNSYETNAKTESILSFFKVEVLEKKLTFPLGLNPLNYLSFIFKRFPNFWEKTFLKHLVPATSVEYTLKVIK